MNSNDDRLNRLFRAAARGHSTRPAVMPYGLETRALAAWHASRSQATGLWDVALLLRGMVLASVVTAGSFLHVLDRSYAITNPFAEFVQLTDATVATEVSP